MVEKNFVTLMMADGVDIEVINDVLEHPIKYIQMLTICDGEFIDLPMHCFYNESLLTAEQKTDVLSILDTYICLWYSLNCGYPNNYFELFDDTIDHADSFESDYFLSDEELKEIMSSIEECPLNFV